MLSKRQFLVKYILMFNIYGNLLIILPILFFLITLYVFKIFSIVIVVFSIVFLFFGVRISVEYKKKYKYYFVTQKKIERNGFDDDYFKWGFIEPCYRILTKFILVENNRGADYKRLSKMFNTNDKVKSYIENKMIEDALKIKWD
jgi:hypothetical protein